MSEYIFKFNDRLQSATHNLKHVPSDLTDYGTSYGKVKGIANIVKKHSVNMKFIKEDAQFLLTRFMDYGVNNRVELTCYRKEILGSTEYFVFSCFIDFQNAQYINGVFECGLYEAGFYQIFDKYYSQIYDIGNEFIEANIGGKLSQIDFKGLKRVTNIKYNYSGSITANGGYGKPMFIIGGTIDTNDSKSSKNYDTLMFKEASGYGFQAINGISLLEKQPIYLQKYQEVIHSVVGTCSFKLKCEIDEYRTKPLNQGLRLRVKAIVNYSELAGIFYGNGVTVGQYYSANIPVSGTQWDSPFEITGTFNFSTTSNIDDIMFIAQIEGLDNNSASTYDKHYANCNVDYFNVEMKVEYQNGLQQLPILNYSTIINALFKKMNTDGLFNISVLTTLLDTELKDKHLLCGGCYTVNNETNLIGYSANVSIETILQALKGYFDIQMCINIDESDYKNVTVWFEKSGSGLSEIHNFGDNISEISISPANDLLYSTILIGSQIDEKTEEDIIDYTKQRVYDTGNIVEKNEYVFTPENISASVTELEAYIKENHRNFLYNAERGISVTNGTPDKFYSLHVNIQNKYGVDEIIYALKRDYRITVYSGMLYPEYAYNLYYTPYNLVSINMREIASLCYLSRTNTLKNIGGQTENQIVYLVNGVITDSNADVIIDRRKAYYLPFNYEFTAPADVRLLQSYNNNRRGYFKFMLNGIEYKGIIAASITDDADGVNIEPFNFKEANVKLLRYL